MKLKTSRILAQLSEQDRSKAETELAELHAHKQRLIQQQQASLLRIKQRDQQRDQAMKNRNAASLLQAFELSQREQQSMLASIDAGFAELENKKQSLLVKFAEAYRTQHAYEHIHDKQKRTEQRKKEHQSQRKLDDMVASRAATAAI
ncbi:MAG: hypothetical protein ACE5E3_02935 [Mariprofundus sp.]